MTFLKRYGFATLLGSSLLLNAAILGYLARSGGLRRIFLKMDLVEMPRTRVSFQQEDEAKFRKYPNTPGEIVFLGDSIVGGGPWSEFFSDIRNRGIGANTTAMLLDRLDEVTESKPGKIFLLIGTNDLAAQVPVAQLARHYRELLGRLREQSPETTINVIGILPVNPTFPRKPTQDNTRIAEANEQIRRLVAEFPKARFLDLSPYLADRDGNLRREFTIDGIHLNTDAYLAIREPLGRALADGRPTKADEGKAGPRAAGP